MYEPLILKTQKELEELKYPTPLAISKDIVTFTNGDEKQISLILKRIQKDEPWEYIKGWTDFCKNKIFVNKDVLIPRLETEELVKIALEKIKKIKEPLQIIEIGTGSGCISIALSKKFNHPIYAIDISKRALQVAKKNIKFHECKNIKLIKANLLDFKFNTKKSTVIIANLPYIPSDKIQDLQSSVREYEPTIALDGGTNGTKCYEELLRQIKNKGVNLKYCLFEIDKQNKKALEKYSGKFIKDSFGRIRFFSIHPSHLK